MHFLILGASGRSGSFTVGEAVNGGHTVTALVRNPASIQARDRLNIVQGTPLDQVDIEKAFSTAPRDSIDAVIVTLAATRTSDSPFAKPTSPPNFVRDCVRNVTAVMAQHNVRRIVVMSAFGIGSSWPELSCLMKPVFTHTNMSYAMSDHEEVDRELRAKNDLDWTLVRPVMLKEGDAAEIKDLGEFGKGAGLLSGITRASVARFLVQVGEDEGWSRKAVVISN